MNAGGHVPVAPPKRLVPPPGKAELAVTGVKVHPLRLHHWLLSAAAVMTERATATTAMCCSLESLLVVLLQLVLPALLLAWLSVALSYDHAATVQCAQHLTSGMLFALHCYHRTIAKH
jgi:hypothetical protein